MRRSWSGAFHLIFLSIVAAGATFGQAISFQAADVHASAKTSSPTMRGGVMRGGRMEIRTATLLDLISFAYGVDSNTIVGGLGWLGTDRFDMIAGAPPDTTQAVGTQMLQALLADRFQLVLKKDTRPMPVFVLSVGKAKHKMKQSDGQGSTGCQQQQPQETVVSNTGAFTVVNCRNLAMSKLVFELRDMAYQYLPNEVVDETGITGTWDFQLRWNARNQLAAAGDAKLTILDAVDKQLGLKLEPQTRPRPAWVIESVNRNPTPNVSDVAKKLPPAPVAEFEVATLRPSPSDAPGRADVQNGHVNVQGITLKELVKAAWDIGNDQLIAGLPKFAETAKFSIIAKAPIPEGATSEQEVDEETLLAMLRNLLVDRFKMKTHIEDRPVEGYTMTAAKPKLEKADPSSRTECKEGPGRDGKDPRNTNPILNRLMTCTNMTAAQFADVMPQRVSGYIKLPVLDATGLEGPWNFTVSFSGTNLFYAKSPNGEPSGAVSFPEAVSKQLGLKLELEKRMLPVLVFDHMEETPTEN